MSMNLAGGIQIAGPQLAPTPLPTPPPSIVVDLVQGLSRVEIGTDPVPLYVGFLGQNIDEPGDPSLILLPRELVFASGTYLRLRADAGNPTQGVVDFLIDHTDFRNNTSTQITTIYPAATSITDLVFDNPKLTLFNTTGSVELSIAGQFYRTLVSGFPIMIVDLNTTYVFTNTRVRVGDNALDPRGWLELDQGADNIPPFVYNIGVQSQSTLVDGAKNFDGNNEFLTANGINFTISKTLLVTANLNFSNIGPNACEDLTITVTGAQPGDPVTVSPPTTAIGTDNYFFAWVSAADTVTVRHCTFSAFDPGAGNFTVSVQKL